MTLDVGGGESWFNAEVTRRVHNRLNTSFWNTKLRGETTFRSKYPRLFTISNQKEAKVADMWTERGTESGLNFNWRRRRFSIACCLIFKALSGLKRKMSGGGSWRIEVALRLVQPTRSWQWRRLGKIGGVWRRIECLVKFGRVRLHLGWWLFLGRVC